ncbi:hypothetical protein [uncultured Tateyamaria sp.]|uniref:hypothetical protein n=1 Tax=uncultured Tateyamaria sp. TaxID=455651 RepID=UPI0026157146|nr:hypothetical protein [uncultured Tateyamaria sp.]
MISYRYLARAPLVCLAIAAGYEGHADELPTLAPSGFERFFVLDGAANAPDAIEQLLTAQWQDQFIIQEGADTGREIAVSSCPSFFAARAAALEPDAPSEWPIYRDYGLRCLALQESVYLRAAPDLIAQGMDEGALATLDLPVSDMVSDEIVAIPPDGLVPILFEDGQGTLTIDADQFTFEVVDSLSTKTVPNATLLVMMAAASLEGSYSTATLFRLDRTKPDGPYSVSRRINARHED